MSWQNEIEYGKRFEFGANWTSFLNNLNENQITQAKEELISWLGDIKDKTFLDIGSGSGIHSLAARMLGAKVYSFDYDLQSVKCTQYLKNQYFHDDENWNIEQGSILDQQYVENLGQFDIVYSWGVLHHTGKMWQSLENAAIPVKKDGMLFIAIYNTQVYWTNYWHFVKKSYNSNILFQYFWRVFYILFFTLKGVVKDIILLKNPLKRYQEYKKNRGMSIYHDIIDWIGGYPFETAKPEEILYFYQQKGYNLEKLYTAGGGMACNQFILKKISTNN